ncbi:hypothetical protein ACFQ1I_29505 [Kitasatospora arboriphila]
MDGLISFNNRPLRIAIYLGLALVGVAALYAAWITGVALVDGVDSPATSPSSWRSWGWAACRW